MGATRTCPRCGGANPEEAHFCMECGSPLARSCPGCGAQAPGEARFCMSCGAALDGGSAPTGPSVSPTGPSAAPQPGPGPAAPQAEERRLVTVLFADVSGYTSVAERLDHETVKRLIERCLTRLASEVERFGGRVDKFIGDNVMAVFGAPVAHEDDPLRAVRAAIAMQAAMGELNEGLGVEFGIELGLRIGVNTGEVLAGRVGDAYTVVGDTVNVAARLQAEAPVGGILVGERTQSSSGDGVSLHAVEPLDLKGKAQPVPAWEVVGLRAPAPAEERRTLRTPLVGRTEELDQLSRAFARVAPDGAPHLATVIGQAGVGKTRLLREFERRLENDGAGVRVHHGRCLAFGSTAVYWPLSEMLRADCEIADADSGAAAWEKLVDRLGPLIADLEDADEVARRLAPLARLVGAEPPASAPVIEDDEQSTRESFFGAVRTMFEALAQEHALVLAWEDIHWADEGTLDLIEYLADWLRAPVLQVCLARDELLERRPGWSGPRRTASVMFLEPLDPAETRDLIDSLLQQTGAASALLETLAERAGGNPLFAETIAQRIIEEGAAAEAELPDTVQGVLAARLDALDPVERELVAHASVAGRSFWESALEPVAAASGADLDVVLRSLRAKDIIVLGERGHQHGERELSFKHVLIRDVAYSMLPKAVRARKHAEVGAFLEQRAGEREGVSGVIAEHYSRAVALAVEAHFEETELGRLRGKALVFGETAGDAAAALFSNAEAMSHYEAAETAATGDEPARARLAEKRGDIALRLGRVDAAVSCWQPWLEYWRSEDEPEKVAELHRKIGAALAHKGERKAAIEQHQQGINLIKERPPSLALVRLYEEAAWLYMQIGDNMLAIYASEKALRLAEQLGAAGAASRAHGIFGRIFGRIGDLERARQNLERAVELARDSEPTETVLALLTLGQHFEQFEGDYEAAHTRYLEALDLAERIGDVPAQIELQAALAQLAYYRCEWPEVRRASDASAQLAEREGLVGKLCLPNTLRALEHWREGDFDSSAKLFSDAHESAERVGWSEVSFNSLLGLAATLRDRRELSAAREALSTAVAVAGRAGLTAQAIQAQAALALVCVLGQDLAAAAQAAEKAAALSEQARYPVGQAAALEARGIVEPLPDAVDTLRAAGEAWQRLGRRLDAARCEQVLGRRLRDVDPAAGAEVLARAAAVYDELGVSHLAEQARVLVAA